MGCSQVRRELLEHFAFREELEGRSAPHLAHLESCAECRREVGIDRALVVQLRRALAERVAGGAPPASSWDLVRRRTVERPARPWTGRLVRWGGMLPAAVAGVLMFATAIAPESALLPGTQSPAFVSSLARQAVPPGVEASGRAQPPSNTYRSPEVEAPLPGWPMAPEAAVEVAASFGDPPIAGRMR